MNPACKSLGTEDRRHAALQARPQWTAIKTLKSGLGINGFQWPAFVLRTASRWKVDSGSGPGM